jgi:hypothetical protein
LDQNTWTIISYIVGLITALVAGAAGAILTNRYTRSQERRRKERDVIEEIYTLALTVRLSIEPSIVAASSPHTTIQSTWVEPMLRMYTLSDLYLQSLKPELEELHEKIMSVENAFTRASYELDGYGHATKKIMPGDFDQITESFRKSFTKLLTTLREFTKKRQ